VVRAASEGYKWLNKEPLALMIGTAGWFIPSNIGVSAFDGKSLFGLFTQSIGENLANFPTGPALSDKFWLYMVTWHLGLFITLTLAQIGIQGRKQEYW
jgi:photosystem I subunit PsaO